MDFRAILRMALDECFEDLGKALRGLTPAERRFQPHPEANHIDFLVWHMARVEDSWIQPFAQGTPRIWQRDQWYQKLGLPEEESGFGYTAQQVASFPRFNFTDLMAYYGAVRGETLRYLEGLTATDLDRLPSPERHPGYTIGKMFSHLVVEESQHVGQVAYLRGLQRGLNQ
jgi:uncharacterized damage-inducible protein DinB